MQLSRKIPSRLDLTRKAADEALKSLRPLKLNSQDLFAVKLCLEEALANAVTHGNQGDEKRFVRMALTAGKTRIALKVRDEGCGFDTRHVPDPTRKANLKKCCGRGIFLIRNYMDKVEFFDRGRGIKMVRFLQKKGMR